MDSFTVYYFLKENNFKNILIKKGHQGKIIPTLALEDNYPLNYIPARDRIVSATLSALLKGKSLAVNNFPASPAVIFTVPTWQVVSAPIGNAAMRSAGVLIGNFAPLSAPVICAWSWSFTDCVMVLTNTYWNGL